MKNKIFFHSFYVSIFFHFILIFMFFFITKRKNYIEFEKNLINIENITTVDLVAMPNILKKDLALINEKKVDKEQMVLKQSTNIDRLKTIKKLREKIDKNNYLKKINQVRGLGVVFSEQANLGVSSNKELDEKDKYFIKLKNIVNSNWNLPSWVDFENKKVLIKVYIENDGSLIRLDLLKSSNDNELDDSAINAIKKSEPFLIAPEKFKEDIKKNGIIFSFP